MKELSKEKGLAKAQVFCAKSEKCRADIRQKLYDWKVNRQDHDFILNSLVKDRFIDEERYVGFYVRDKFILNKWGKIKIEYALRNKQIPNELIQQNLEKINDQEYINTCKELIIKKKKTIKEANIQKLKEKLMRFAVGRGYEASLAISVINSLITDNNFYEENNVE